MAVQTGSAAEQAHWGSRGWRPTTRRGLAPRFRSGRSDVGVRLHVHRHTGSHRGRGRARCVSAGDRPACRTNIHSAPTLAHTHLLAVRPRPAVPDRGQPPPALLNAAAISHLALTSRRHARRAIQRPNRPPARSVSTSWALRRKKRARKRPVRMQCLALHLPWRERHRCARSPSKMRETRPHVTCAIEYSMAHTLG
jgi:hypothetical protein